MSALQDALRTYVANARHDPGSRAALEGDALNSSGCFYLDTGSVLCVQAHAASLSHINGSQLPTRISTASNNVLTALRELVNAGLITGAGFTLHDLDQAVTLQSF